MDYLYSLYDALVSINVPNDKARAVVDAMERDMTTTLATKADLLLVKADIQLVKADLQLLEQKLAAAFREETQTIRREIDRTVVRLGALIVIVAGLLAALKLI